ncbi:MAG: acyltransferase [Pseudomonadota bacterium]
MRNPNLDLVRTTAITMVLVYHLGDRWTGISPLTKDILAVGKYGVDLFFALSGWLIGSLFWKETVRQGRVEIGRFIARRALRTMPPYFVALLFAWLGVWYFRGEPFDFGYLLFVQNFYDAMPFFWISWSLCVEEQFYLTAPWVLAAAWRWRRSWLPWLWVMILLAPVFRIVFAYPYREGDTFGFLHTATIFRFEGLTLGVWAAFLCYTEHRRWQCVRRWAGRLWPVGVMLVVAPSLLLPKDLFYYIGYTLVSIGCAIVVVAAAVSGEVIGRFRPMIYGIAVASYSTYLTHTMALDAEFRFLRLLGLESPIVLIPMLAGLYLVGAVFYMLVERPTMILRERLVARRTQAT